MAGGDEHMAKAAGVVELAAALDGRDPLHALSPKALVPPALGADLVDVLEELAHSRVIAVEPALHEWNRALATERRADREPRKRARRAMAVALGAHATLANRRRPHPPLAGRVGVRSEHVDFGGSESPVSEGCIADEAREPPADNRALLRAAHFTEPARSPCTK